MIHLVSQHRDAIIRLCREYHVRRLDLFGSAACEERFDPQTSDLDFLVEFEPEYDLGPWLSRYFELRSELERLLERPVDLVMSQAPRNPFFAASLNATRRLVYAA